MPNIPPAWSERLRLLLSCFMYFEFAFSIFEFYMWGLSMWFLYTQAVTLHNDILQNKRWWYLVCFLLLDKTNSNRTALSGKHHKCHLSPCFFLAIQGLTCPYNVNYLSTGTKWYMKHKWREEIIDTRAKLNVGGPFGCQDNYMAPSLSMHARTHPQQIEASVLLL